MRDGRPAVSLIIHIDGGARGNPGLAGAGVVIMRDDGRLVHEAAYFLGRQTNNAAEYHALIRALDRAQHYPPQPLQIFSDSELLVRQITGEYRVKNPQLQKLYGEVQQRLLRVSRWSLRHVRREQNSRADELANLAMDQEADVLVFDEEPGAAGAKPGNAQIAEGGSLDAKPAGSKGAAARGRGSSEHTAVTPLPGAGERGVRVVLSSPPAIGACPAGLEEAHEFQIGATLPPLMCVHAAHAILPTVLAILNTEPQEFAAVPTMTVRCSHPGCGATFLISPLPSANGSAAEEEDDEDD